MWRMIMEVFCHGFHELPRILNRANLRRISIRVNWCKISFFATDLSS